MRQSSSSDDPRFKQIIDKIPGLIQKYHGRVKLCDVSQDDTYPTEVYSGSKRPCAWELQGVSKLVFEFCERANLNPFTEIDSYPPSGKRPDAIYIELGNANVLIEEIDMKEAPIEEDESGLVPPEQMKQLLWHAADEGTAMWERKEAQKRAQEMERYRNIIMKIPEMVREHTTKNQKGVRAGVVKLCDVPSNDCEYASYGSKELKGVSKMVFDYCEKANLKPQKNSSRSDGDEQLSIRIEWDHLLTESARNPQ